MNRPDQALPSLGPIRCVTVTAPDLAEAEHCYTEYLGYHAVGRGFLSEELVGLWKSPGLVGNRYLLLSPPAGDDCIFRFIEAETARDLVPFSTFGWNAAEIMVKNVDALAERLHDSPFELVGAPANLSFTDDIRAMQILGPGRELLYLTEFKRQIPEFDTPVARSDVDHVFIVILGGPSIAALQDFFAARYGVPKAPVVESRVKGMSAAFGNSPEHKYPISALPLAGKSMIEVDEMPHQAGPRPGDEGSLPAGIAMVSFAGRHLQHDQARRIRSADPPYARTSSVSCCKGVAGEIIEILHEG